MMESVMEGRPFHLCQINNVDVVSYTRAVLGGVVRPKYGKVGALADGDLGERHRKEVIAAGMSVWLCMQIEAYDACIWKRPHACGMHACKWRSTKIETQTQQHAHGKQQHAHGKQQHARGKQQHAHGKQQHAWSRS